MKTPTLGELEQKIMDILWEHTQGSARDVLTFLGPDRKLAYTTVATILNRLHDKGLLKKTDDKWGQIYSPKISKESFSQSVAQTFLKKFIHSFGDIAIASFAQSVDKLPEQKKKYFLDILTAYDNKK